MENPDSWLAFWQAPNRIYVNRRHQMAHYAGLHAAIRPFLPFARGSTMLDWGCGDALAAPQMAETCGTVLLYDAVGNMRSQLRSRYGGDPRIKVLDEDDLAKLPPCSVDFILVNSVIQYLTRSQFIDALRTFHRVLRPAGSLLLGDVIEPGTSMVKDACNLLLFAARNEFLLSAIVGLMATFLSPYRKLRQRQGLSWYSASDLNRALADSGFSGEMLPANIAPSRHRRSYLCRKLCQ
ncbi:MAG: class I SAM-dependent methyltransferase [Alphaproteobacteria bacterium]|nr:class I SAM-dependent methyltransferase [Alphaproteobacteria bacterium]